jgi:hypothetical protein
MVFGRMAQERLQLNEEGFGSQGTIAAIVVPEQRHGGSDKAVVTIHR